MHFSLFSFEFSSFSEKVIFANILCDIFFELFWSEEDCFMNCNWSDLLLFLYYFNFIYSIILIAYLLVSLCIIS